MKMSLLHWILTSTHFYNSHIRTPLNTLYFDRFGLWIANMTHCCACLGRFEWCGLSIRLGNAQIVRDIGRGARFGSSFHQTSSFSRHHLELFFMTLRSLRDKCALALHALKLANCIFCRSFSVVQAPSSILQ
jgi:hypothetical protein